MKINAIITAKKIKSHEQQERGVLPFFAFGVLAVGLVLGNIIYYVFTDYLSQELIKSFAGFTTEFVGRSASEIFSGLLIGNLPLFLVVYVLGTSTRGYIFIYMLSFIKTFGLGVLSSFIFCTYGLRGIEYCLLIFFPGKILLIFSVMLLTVNCAKASLEISKKIKENNDSQIDIAKYDLRTIIIYIFVFLSSLIDFLVIICFSSLFSFV